ncbi:MAG: arsenite efflux transporter metallochaperone ArsD [Pseudomonadota bacterium]|jgi:AhpD family alkylhydroperoxidase
MTTVRVFDPAMDDSTGVRGPSFDPQLVRFAADLDWLKTQGVTVQRFTHSQEPAAFTDDVAVKAVLETTGEAGLPLVQVDGDVKSSGTYPSREELATWASVGAQPPSLFTETVAELVAIGAAIATNNDRCFKFHFAKASKLGVSREDMLRAAIAALNVKGLSAAAMPEVAQRHLMRAPADASASQERSGNLTASCCGPAPQVREVNDINAVAKDEPQAE